MGDKLYFIGGAALKCNTPFNFEFTEQRKLR